MADIATARVEPHEIAQNQDFEFGFQSIIRNTAILDRMLMSAQTDYLAGGFVRAVAGTMAFSVDALWANGRAVDLPAYRDGASGPVAVIAPESWPRYDIVQARGVFESFDTQRRAFYDSELQAAQFLNIDTKNRLVVEIEVKQGNEGVDRAPEADTGYVKLAEIYLEPGTAALAQDSIRNVTAAFQGSENAGWTTEKMRTFLLGSVSDVWEAFGREHYADGRHREAVIKANNILRGVAEGALKGSDISVGENVNAGDLSLLATKTLAEALVAVGQILQGGTANTLLKKLSMLVSWKSTETYQPFAPAFFQGRIYYANPLNLPQTGESPGNSPGKWNNAAGDVIFPPPADGRLYGMENRVWTELNIGGNSVEALKFHSGKSITFTNARTADRRLKGWDLGLAYLSANHKVYHFDTDNSDQNQQSGIAIAYTGDAPTLKGNGDSTEDLSFEPAVSDLVPCETGGKSLYGNFSAAGTLAAQNSTLEFWMRIFVAENSVLFRLGTAAQDMVTLGIGGADPEYYAAAPGDIPYSMADNIDGLSYCSAKTSGNTLYHDWGEGNESIDLDAAGVELVQRSWLHVAFVLTGGTIGFFIGTRQFSFDRKRPVADALPFTINENMEEFNLDELSVIAGAAADFGAFSQNTENRIPYAALDYTQKHAVIMVDDPDKFWTNMFDGSQFKAAVRAAINGN
ncbi:MAG: hypothetical protein LBK61_02110 [Spirochaetaceae bacterium]|jgi:hypothetical protein|nr:hypothetical protein [Spirochaetaceae bacterium]